MLEERFQILDHEVTASSDMDSLMNWLRDILVRPVCHFPIKNKIGIDLRLNGNFLELSLNGRPIQIGEDPAGLTVQAEAELTRAICNSMPHYVRLHAGLGTWKNVSFLVCGNMSMGKTTLLVNLLLRGAAILSDDNVILTDSEAIAYPRKFHLYPSTVELLPDLAPFVRGKREYRGPNGDRFYFFDPTDAGRAWDIEPHDIGAIIFLESNFGGESTIGEMSSVEAAQRLMFQAINLAEKPHEQIDFLCNLVNGSTCYKLSFGDIEAGTDLVLETLSAVGQRS